MSCSAVFCSSRTTTKGGVKDPEISFHTFPKCPDIRRAWIKAVRRDNWEPTKYSRLCSKHFEQSCYISGLSIKKLKTDAVPTIFKGYPVYYQPEVKKRKQPQHRNENQLTPRKGKKMQESGEDTEDLPTTPMQAARAVRALAQCRMVALRRLRTVKRLRENQRRLEKKNATLLNVINDMKNKDYEIFIVP